MYHWSVTASFIHEHWRKGLSKNYFLICERRTKAKLWQSLHSIPTCSSSAPSVQAKTYLRADCWKKLANFIWYCSTAFPLAENSSAPFPQQPGKISCVPKLKSHLHFDKHLFHAWVMCTAQEFSVWFHLHLQTETTLLFPLQTNMNRSSLLVRVISLDINLRQTVITRT